MSDMTLGMLPAANPLQLPGRSRGCRGVPKKLRYPLPDCRNAGLVFGAHLVFHSSLLLWSGSAGPIPTSAQRGASVSQKALSPSESF